MGNMNFKDYDSITINFDDGTKGKFKFSDLVELDGNSYIILSAYEDDTLISIYKVDNIEKSQFSPLEDEDIEKQVLDIYYKREQDSRNKMSKINLNYKYLQEIKLDLVNGTTGKFKFLEQIQLNGESYAVLLPDGGNGAIVHIYKLKLENNGILRFLQVEDKEVEKQVLDIYNKGEHNYLNKKSVSKHSTLITIIIFLTITLVSGIILGNCWGTLHQKNFADSLLMLIIPCAFTLIPSAMVTGIICGIFGIGTKDYKNSDEVLDSINNDLDTIRSIDANMKAIQLECKANETKDPNLRAQLRAQAAQLRLLNK